MILRTRSTQPYIGIVEAKALLGDRVKGLDDAAILVILKDLSLIADLIVDIAEEKVRAE